MRVDDLLSYQKIAQTLRHICLPFLLKCLKTELNYLVCFQMFSYPDYNSKETREADFPPQRRVGDINCQFRNAAEGPLKNTSVMLHQKDRATHGQVEIGVSKRDCD